MGSTTVDTCVFTRGPSERAPRTLFEAIHRGLALQLGRAPLPVRRQIMACENDASVFELVCGSMVVGRELLYHEL